MHQSVVSAATLRLMCWAYNVATVYDRGCTGTTVNVNLLHLHTSHLLIARNAQIPLDLSCRRPGLQDPTRPDPVVERRKTNPRQRLDSSVSYAYLSGYPNRLVA